MERQLINEAKRLQQLAGIKEMKINIPSQFKGSNVWIFSEPGNPNEAIYSSENGENEQYYTKGEFWDRFQLMGHHHNTSVKSTNKGVLTTISDTSGGDIINTGFVENKDFVFVPQDLIELMDEAYGAESPEEDSFTEYLDINDWTVDTSSDEWDLAVELFGDENKLRNFMRYLKVKVE